MLILLYEGSTGALSRYSIFNLGPRDILVARPVNIDESQKATERIGGAPIVVFRRETTSRKTSERPPKDSVVVTISPRADAMGLREGTILG